MRATRALVVGLTLIAAAVSGCGDSEKISTPAVAETATFPENSSVVTQAPVVIEAPVTEVPVTEVPVTEAPVVTQAPVITEVPLGAVTDSTGPRVATGPGAGTPFCDSVEALDAATAVIDPIFNADVPNPADVEAAFDGYLEQMRAVQTEAPEQIAADIDLVTAQFEQFAALLADADFDIVDFFSAPDNQDFIESMGGQEFTDAGVNLDAYTDAECGIVIDD